MGKVEQKYMIAAHAKDRERIEMLCRRYRVDRGTAVGLLLDYCEEQQLSFQEFLIKKLEY